MRPRTALEASGFHSPQPAATAYQRPGQVCERNQVCMRDSLCRFGLGCFPSLAFAFAFHFCGKKLAIVFSHISNSVSSHHLPSYLLHPQNKPRYVCVCVCILQFGQQQVLMLKYQIQFYSILCMLLWWLHSLLEFCIWVSEGWELGFKILGGNLGLKCIIKSLQRVGFISLGLGFWYELVMNHFASACEKAKARTQNLFQGLAGF